MVYETSKNFHNKPYKRLAGVWFLVDGNRVYLDNDTYEMSEFGLYNQKGFRDLSDSELLEAMAFRLNNQNFIDYMTEIEEMELAELMADELPSENIADCVSEDFFSQELELIAA